MNRYDHCYASGAGNISLEVSEVVTIKLCFDCVSVLIRVSEKMKIVFGNVCLEVVLMWYDSNDLAYF